MQAIKRFNLFVVTSLSLWLLAGPAGAADTGWSCASNTPPLRVEVRYEGGPGMSAANRAYVTAGTNKFVFQMPAGFRLETADPQKVTLVSADYNCLLTWRILGPVPAASPDLDPAACRELLLERHLGGQILEEFDLPALG